MSTFNIYKASMITHYFRTVKDNELKIVDEVRAGVWTHAVSPTEEELAELIEKFGLDPAIIEDAQDFFEVPRLELSGNATYFFTRYPFDEQKEDVDTAPLLIVVGESYVLTLAQREVPCLKPLIAGTEVVNTTQKAKLFIQIVEKSIQAFEKELIYLRRSVQKNRAKIRDIGPNELIRFVEYEHELNDLISSLVPTNASLAKILNGTYIQLFNEDREAMNDLLIANSQMIDSAKVILKTIQNVRGASEAILTSRLNTTIKTLTILTIVLTVPMIISSLYGMNVSLPFAEHIYAFWLILTLILMTVALVGWSFKRSGWL